LQVDTELRGWAKLPFQDPEPVLQQLRKLEIKLSGLALDPLVRRLRTTGLKEAREVRNAAIFAHGMATATGTKVYFAASESSDYDFVTAWHSGGQEHFCPVQLKELPPLDLSGAKTLSCVLSSLGKYQPTRTVLAVLLNQPAQLPIAEIPSEARRFKQMWLYWSTSPDEWRIQGDTLAVPAIYSFQYPALGAGTA
jgi:hypothetical protein